jgi:hypothetical protein
MKYETIFPVKGRGRGQMHGMITTSKSEVDGQVVLTYHVNDPAYKRELLFRRIKREKDSGMVPRVILPWRVTEEFVDELQNEVLQVTRDRFGFEKSEFVKKGANDYLDVLKYGLVIWDLNEPVLRAAGMLEVKSDQCEVSSDQCEGAGVVMDEVSEV